MATNGEVSKDARSSVQRAAGPRAWRVLVPVIGAALAVLVPALALGGRAIRNRREQSSRTPRLAVVPVLGGLLTVVGAVAWRNRERVLEVADDAVATAEETAGALAGRLAGDGAQGQPAMSDASFETFDHPATEGAPAA